MAKYCIYRDRPIGSTAIAQATGDIEGLGCEIFGVKHLCKGCPNCIEMGDGGDICRI